MKMIKIQNENKEIMKEKEEESEEIHGEDYDYLNY